MSTREKQNTDQPLTSAKTLCMTVHLTFIIISKPELVILKVCFWRNTFVVQVHEVVPLCHRKTRSRHYEKYALKKSTLILAICVLWNISGLKSQERSQPRQRRAYEHICTSIHTVYGREEGIFWGKSWVPNRVVKPQLPLFFVIFISMMTHLLGSILDCVYISSVYFISMNTLV